MERSYKSKCACVVLLLIALLATNVNACQREQRPNHCYSENYDFYQKCSVSQSTDIKCVYAKVNSSNIEAKEIFPDKPQNFTVNVYTTEIPGVYDKCPQVFNFTWKLPWHGVDYLEGFLLNITFDDNGTQRRILRRFNVNITAKETLDLRRTIVFYYDCVILKPNTKYWIELYSVPKAPPDMRNYEAIYLPTSDIVDANNTGNWKSSIWVKEDVTSSSIKVCFTLAPAHFHFSSYGIELFGSSSSRSVGGEARYSHTVKTDNQMRSAYICHSFTEVCPDIYHVEVRPEATHGSDCNCKLEAECRKFCSEARLDNVDFGGSKLYCPPTTPQWPDPDYPERDNVALIVGLVVGSVLAMVILFFICRRKPPKEPPPGNPKSILILHSDNIYKHLAAVFAEFLAKTYACQVRTLCTIEESDIKASIQQVWNLIVNADSTLFIISDEGCKCYSDMLDGKIIPLTQGGSRLNFAVVAALWKLTWESEFETIRKKSYHLQFPNSINDQQVFELIKRNFQTYKLPRELELLVEVVCGIKKPCKTNVVAFRNWQKLIKIGKKLIMSAMPDDDYRVSDEEEEEEEEEEVAQLPLNDNNNQIFCENLNDTAIQSMTQFVREESHESGYCSISIKSDSPGINCISPSLSSSSGHLPDSTGRSRTNLNVISQDLQVTNYSRPTIDLYAPSMTSSSTSLESCNLLTLT